MKRFFIRGSTIFAILFVALIFGLAFLIAPTTTAIAAPMINDQITALDTTAGPGPRLAATQSENFEFYEVATAIGPGQKSDVDFLGAGANENTLIKLYAKDDLSLRALSGLRNDVRAIVAGNFSGETVPKFLDIAAVTINGKRHYVAG